MKNTFVKNILVSGLILTSAGLALAANPTPKYWKCSNKVFGSWSSFGVYTEACDVDPFGDRGELRETYSPLVIPNKPSSTELHSYMGEMYAVVRDISEYYLKQRKPQVGRAEILAFQEAIFALAHQESFWSHYRNTNSTDLKMIRGDYGHGHGLMQVDDRHHYLPVKSGMGAKLGVHFAYALDIFYEAWQRAPSQSCVSSSTDYLSRTRAAYGAYNGGPGSACRWTNPNHTWYRNDKNYLNKFERKQWLNYVSDKNKPASINIACLSQGHENCPKKVDPTPVPDTKPSEYSDDVFYMNSKGLFCAHLTGRLYCMEQYRDAACLNARLGRNIDQSVPFASSYKDLPIQLLDRNELCQEQIQGLAANGDSLEVLKAINLRDSPAGNLVGVVASGEVVQVIDFEVKNDATYKRYYKLKQGDKEGYIYAGDKSDFGQWTRPAAVKVQTASLLAEAGDQISIVIASGINQRSTPGGTLIQRIPTGTPLDVERVVTTGANNYIYYEVIYRGQRGFIYAGQGYPEVTYQQWAKVNDERVQVAQQLAQISSYVYYRRLTVCDTQSCKESDHFVPGPRMKVQDSERILEVHRTTTSGWAYVTHLSSGKFGWLPVRDLRMNNE